MATANINQQTRPGAVTTPTSTSTFSRRSSASSASSAPSNVMSVCRSVARHAGGIAKQMVKVPLQSMSPRDKKPDMSKMRTVTPVYDPELKRWVWPHPVQVHRDEPTGSPCKQLPTPNKPKRQING